MLTFICLKYMHDRLARERENEHLNCMMRDPEDRYEHEYEQSWHDMQKRTTKGRMLRNMQKMEHKQVRKVGS
jgi:hypothetical protein